MKPCGTCCVDDSCKACDGERQRVKAAKAGRSRKNSLKNNYGLTTDQYNELLRLQDGCCGCCGTHHTKVERRLAVDHCHETLEIRGLLCSLCNTGIGKLGDNLEGVLRASTYLLRPSTGLYTPR